jgi:two-component system alkaline phosphatase synthesis response regulator PhoP
MWKLLVIDDDSERTEQISDWFEPIGFEVARAHSGKDGLQKAREGKPDIILLDILMPGMDGHEVLLRLKRDPITANVPVVILSFKADELDGLQELMRSGLREGADYIVAKKWGIQALEEVIRRVLALPERPQSIKVGVDELILGPGYTEVWVNDVKKTMTPMEARVLAYLDEHRGETCSVKTILDSVFDGIGDASSVYKVIARIRRKIEPHKGRSTFLHNVKGHGYRLGGSSQAHADK